MKMKGTASPDEGDCSKASRANHAGLRVMHDLLNKEQMVEERGMGGLMAKLEVFLKEKESEYLRGAVPGRGGDLYFFEMRGAPEELEEDQEFALRCNQQILISKKEFGQISISTRDANTGKRIVALLSTRADKVQLYREDPKAEILKDGTYSVRVSPGIQMDDVPVHVLPDDAVQVEAGERVERMVENIIKCATLVKIATSRKGRSGGI